MKLHSIKLKNFRLFKEEIFEFKPLTILVGPNSSGKSTVVKALMLLQENLKAPNYLGRLTFKTGNHRLGSFESVLTSGVEDKTIGFELKFEAEKPDDRTRHHQNIFDDVKFFIVSYQYEQDSVQKENGVLKQYRISIVLNATKANENGPEPLEILSVEKVENESLQYIISINFKWIINNILSKGLFSIRPNVYVIYEKDDKIKASDFNNEFKRRKLELNKQKKQELLFVEKAQSKKNTDLNSRRTEDEQEIADLEKKAIEIGLYYENIINKLEDDMSLIKSKYEHIETEDEEKYVDLEINVKSSEINQKEEERDQAIRQIEDEKYQLQEKLDNYKKTMIAEIEEKFESLKEKIDRGAVRSEVYSQVMAGCRKYLESLSEIEFRYFLNLRRNETIADILMKKEWAPGIEDVLQKEENTPIVDVFEWPDNLMFIKNILEKDEMPITFRQVIEDNNHINQFASLLVENIYFIISKFVESIPFIPVSAMRGFQQRVYQTNHPEFHLEEALSTLLTMQYDQALEKLGFIQKWVQKFEIGQELKAEVIEGDYVKGFILDEEGNEMNIADKGLGIAQLIPIIIYTADAIDLGRLVCVEEPGTHLHPDLQARLVEFVQDAIGYGVQFLFETHSEYFIRKLQYEVSHNGVNLENVLIRYLNRKTNESKFVYIDSNGELTKDGGEVIDTFGDGFLDEATKWVTQKKALQEIKKGNKVIVCEGNNRDCFEKLGFSNCIFYSTRAYDSKTVFMTICKSPEIFGIRDRDFLLDEEIQELEEKYSNYKILRYYCFENYLYHPENVFEAAQKKGFKDFDQSIYVSDILSQRNEKHYEVLMSVEKARTTYEDLKTLYGKKDRKDKKNLQLIKDQLLSDEFEVFYKFFSMKDYFDKSGLEKYKLKELDYISTNWFKHQIANILNLKY